ncbi:MAG: WG repeat-containing protein, partial [Bacteroidia bacterium]
PHNNAGKWGYVDTLFKIRIQPVYSRAFPFVNGKALVVDNDTLRQIDTAGNELQRYKGKPGDAAFGTITLMYEGRKALVSFNGTILLKPRYVDLLVIDCNMVAVVTADSTAGTISYAGDTLEAFRRIDMSQFDKLVAVNNKPECTFCRLSEFSENRALAFGDTFFGYTDSSGTVVIPYVFEQAEPFLFDLAFVVHNTSTKADANVPKSGYVDRLGRFYYSE